MSISQALAALLGSNSPAETAARGGSSSSGSNGGGSNGSGTRQLLPTVAILSTEGGSGRGVQVALVLTNPSSSSNALGDGSSSSSGSNGSRVYRDVMRPWLGFVRDSNSSSSGLFVMASPSWERLVSAVPMVPVGLLYAAIVIGVLDLAVVAVMAVVNSRAAGVGFWRQLVLAARMRGGCKLPDDVTKEAASQMIKDNGRRLLLSNVYHWATHTQHTGVRKLHLVPR
jgi:hypothetical protein